MKTEFQMKYIL